MKSNKLEISRKQVEPLSGYLERIIKNAKRVNKIEGTLLE